MRYDIDVSKIPYLSSFVDFQANTQPQSTEFVHGPILLFNVALKGIESGYRQCFRSLPADLSQHHILCDTYDFLRIPPQVSMASHGLQKTTFLATYL
jgi:hypothetical protein